MMCSLLAVAGVVTGVVVGRASASKATRGIFKTAIKGTLAAGRAIQAVASEAKEELSDIAAEAKADLAKGKRVEARVDLSEERAREQAVGGPAKGSATPAT